MMGNPISQIVDLCQLVKYKSVIVLDGWRAGWLCRKYLQQVFPSSTKLMWCKHITPKSKP